MSAVLVSGDRVVVPSGWCVVVMDCMKKGDRYLTSELRWADTHPRDFGVDVEEAIVVIRRDPQAKETP